MDDQPAAALGHRAPRSTGNGALPPGPARVTTGIKTWHECCLNDAPPYLNPPGRRLTIPIEDAGTVRGGPALTREAARRPYAADRTARGPAAGPGQ